MSVSLQVEEGMAMETLLSMYFVAIHGYPSKPSSYSGLRIPSQQVRSGSSNGERIGLLPFHSAVTMIEDVSLDVVFFLPRQYPDDLTTRN